MPTSTEPTTSVIVINEGGSAAIYGDIAVMTVKDDGQVSIEAYKRYHDWMNDHRYILAMVASEKIAIGERGIVQIEGPLVRTLEMLER